MLAEADTMRAQLANTVDVSTLVEWIKRNRRTRMRCGPVPGGRCAGGTQTAKVRRAMDAERDARAICRRTRAA